MKFCSFCSLLYACSWMLGCAVLAAADDGFPGPNVEIRTTEITVDPAAESAPALKYKLFPIVTETTRGNAAARYMRAITMIAERSPLPAELRDKVQVWYEQRAAELPVAEVKAWLASQQHIFREIEVASRCESCDWGIRFHELRDDDVIGILLPDLQQTRQAARLLRLKAQVEIAERRLEDAIATLKMAYRLADDVGKHTNIIGNLVSAAIASMINEVTLELIETPGSPNLYWALRSLPNPTADQLESRWLEANTVYQLFPFLKTADTDQASQEEWQRRVAHVIHSMRNLNSYPSRTSPAEPLSAMVTAIRCYPVAKRELLARGMERTKLEAMPVGQVVSIYARNCWQHVIDESMKWAILPYDQGIAHLSTLHDTLKRDGYLQADPSSLPERDPLLLSTVLWNTSGVNDAFIRRQRMVALLATIEAIRMQSVSDQRKLPQSLDQISIVPVPLDPARMKYFLYRVVGDHAELVAPPTIPGNQYSGRRFLIRMR